MHACANYYSTIYNHIYIYTNLKVKFLFQTNILNASFFSLLFYCSCLSADFIEEWEGISYFYTIVNIKRKREKVCFNWFKDLTIFLRLQFNSYIHVCGFIYYSHF